MRLYFLFYSMLVFVGMLLEKTAVAQDTLQRNMPGSMPDTVKATSQKPEEKKNTLVISADMRTRFELRHGYRIIPTKDTGAAAFITQRTRLNINYKSRIFDFYASLQDARVWGQQDPREGQSGVNPTESTTYPLYFFEVYAEPHLSDKFSIRIGRQRIVYDNQRLFSENDWRLAANSHDAVRMIYNNKINFTTELVGAFNQYGENNFTTNYKPVGFINYKTLLIHYLNWKINPQFTFTSINAADGYQSSKPTDYKTTYMRLTSGGRLEFSTPQWYATFAGYYQYGKDSAGKKLSAYYLQPEIKYSGIKNFSIRLGMEYLSGQDTLNANDNNFVPLYGTGHRYIGHLDYFTSFPGDLNNGGIINPYLAFQLKHKKITVNLENHLFYSQSNAAFKGRGDLNKFLGFESDASLNYKPVDFADIEAGFSWASVTKSMVAVKKTGDADAFPYFFYLSLRFTPVIGKFSF